MRCWRVGKDSFKATGLLLCGEIFPYVLCYLCGTEEIGRSLMVLSDLLMLSRSKPFDWMLAVGNIPLMSFVYNIDFLSL